MPTMATLMADADRRGLIRKIQRAVGMIGPMSVPLPANLLGPDALPIDLKAAGFKPVGIVTPDGYSFERDIEKDDIDALGYASYVRSDITRVARTVSFQSLETGRRHMLELELGQDLSGVTQDQTSGEFVIDEVDLPIGAEYRFLTVGDDGPASANWVMGKGYGTAKLASVGGETWSKEGAVMRELTLDIFTDETLGTPVRHYFGGTGAKASADILGFTQAPPALATITSVEPSGATTGQQVTIKGTGFIGTTAIAFGAVNAPTFTVIDSTTIVATVPAAAAGMVNVTVTNAAGTSAGFAYTRGA